MDSILHTEKLYWSFGKQEILHDISLEVENGKFYGIVGPNGSGKTTFLRNLTTFYKPSRNVVFIEGNDILECGHKEIAQKIAFVPQEKEMYFDFTVEEVVSMGRYPFMGRFQQELYQRDWELIEDAMEYVGLLGLRKRNFSELSGGERQRVIIARALAQDTKILILDEPANHLDLQYQIQFYALIKSLIKEKDVTVIATLHDLNAAATFCDFIFMLYDGKLKHAGTPEKVFTSENISNVFKTNVYVGANPLNGKPHVYF